MKKTIVFLLLAAVTLTALASCGEAAATPGTPAATASEGDSSADVTTAEETTIEYHADLPDGLDYEGATFTIIVEDNLLDTRLYKNAVFEAENGDTIADAMYRRCLAVEELLNVDVTQIAVSGAESTAQKAIIAGDDAYQMTNLSLSSTKNLAASGYLRNLLDLDYIDTDAPWWDANFKRELSIFGKLYFDTGDIMVFDDMRVTSAYFNKGLWAEFGLEDPYQLVKDGKWTVERFFELGSGYTFDLDGDGALTQTDQWGILSEYWGPSDLYFAAGEHMISLDDDGVPTIRITSERAATVATRLLTLFLDESNVFLADRISGQSDIWAYASQMFQEDRVLLRTSCFENIPRDYRAMDTDFGVLPLPKYDESQDTYYTDARADIFVAAIPASVANADFAAAVVEALAAESKNILTPAFYEVSLQGKVLRDNESEDMLDILFANKVYDLGYLYQVGSMQSIIYDMANKRSTDFQSTLASKLSSYETALEKIITTYQELG